MQDFDKGNAAGPGEEELRLLKNPLPQPVPKPHIRMEFDLEDPGEDDFDLEISEDDDFDF